MKRLLILSLCMGSCLIPDGICFFGASPLPSMVTVIGDGPTTVAAWASQLDQMTKQIEKARVMIDRTDQLLQIAGDPRKMLESMKDINEATRQLDMIFKTDATRSARKLLGSLNRFNSAQARFDKTVGETMIVSGEKRERNHSLYSSYRLLDATIDDYNSIMKNDEKVQKMEHERRLKLSKELEAASTQAEIDKINAAISLSKSNSDASSSALEKKLQELQILKEREKVQADMEKKAKQEEHDATMDDLNTQYQKEKSRKAIDFENRIKRTETVRSSFRL